MASAVTNKEFYDDYFDSRQYIQTYLAQQSEFFDDLTGMFNGFLKIFTSGGAVEGNTLIQILLAPFIHYTVPICDYFTEIIFASPHDKTIEEVEKWLKNKPDAMDLSDIQKQKNCDEKLNIVRRKAKQVLKCDVLSSAPLSPISLPQADCLLLTHCLELFVIDKKTFCGALKNISSLLKTGGHLILTISLGCTYFMAGTVKCPHLYLDDEFVRSAVIEAGYVVVDLHICTRQLNKSYDVSDFTAICSLKARKEREMSSDT
ncbi:nicotinamide N-methyltransferase-like [Lissotriton helveticus]